MIKAFILAAGFGERLRPITSHIPKPLLPVLGKPVIERLVQRVLAVPVARVGVNAHYKAEMLGQWAETSDYADKIELHYEQKILGTGGALKNAERFLRSSTFLVHNADIFSDINLGVLIEKHISEGNVATLAANAHGSNYLVLRLNHSGPCWQGTCRHGPSEVKTNETKEIFP